MHDHGEHVKQIREVHSSTVEPISECDHQPSWRTQCCLAYAFFLSSGFLLKTKIKSIQIYNMLLIKWQQSTSPSIHFSLRSRLIDNISKFQVHFGAIRYFFGSHRLELLPEGFSFILVREVCKIRKVIRTLLFYWVEKVNKFNSTHIPLST